MKRIVTTFGAVLVLALIAAFAITTESKSATVTPKGAGMALLVVDLQLMIAGVDVSFVDSLFTGDPPFWCEDINPCDWGVVSYRICRTQFFPPLSCDLCESISIENCRGPFGPSEECHWTTGQEGVCELCVSLARAADDCNTPG